MLVDSIRRSSVTQERLALSLGYDPTLFSRILRGLRPMPADFEPRLYEVLDRVERAELAAQTERARVEGIPVPARRRGGVGATNGAAPEVYRRAYKVSEVADLLGVSRASIDKLIRTGQLRACRAGRRVLVPTAAVEEYLAASLPSGEAPGQG